MGFITHKNFLTTNYFQTTVYICIYSIAILYCLELWPVLYKHLVSFIVGGNSIITKINTGSRINTRSFWVHNNNYIHLVL